MARTVAVGEQDFGRIIENNYFYIDKTGFIKEWWENGDPATLITRPRRFGKTLTISMVEHFFSLRYAGRADLFENLAIWKEEIYHKLQGAYPVISFSFANVKADNYEETYYSISRLIAREYRRHAYLLDSSRLLPSDRSYFEKLLNGDANTSDVCTAFDQLCEYLYDYYNKKVIILLDEYDTPMQEAYVNGYWKELTAFMRKFMNATFKANPCLERGLMTGITRVSKESVFSGLNNLQVITTTSRKYASAFGFTENEVCQALGEFGLLEYAKDVKRWYDGFHFGDCSSLYNPWSIIKFLDEKEFAPYWANTSSNKLVGKLIQKSSPHIKTTMEALMHGKAFRAVIDEQIVFDQLDGLESAIWSFLLASGYLKAVSWQSTQRGKKECLLALANLEVHGMFEDMFTEWFSVCTPYYNDFITALLSDDLKNMNAFLNHVTFTTISFFDTGNHPSASSEPERFYHGLVLGLMAELSGRYTITSNRESGFGRYDVLLEPLEGSDDGMILEFKVAEPELEKSLADTAKAALMQITEKKYAAILENRGISKDKIRIYGFAFSGKKVLIDGGYLQNYMP